MRRWKTWWIATHLTGSAASLCRIAPQFSKPMDDHKATNDDVSDDNDEEGVMAKDELNSSHGNDEA